jgi:hypothetical protein
MNVVTYPYQVKTWLPKESALRIMGQARWIEQCRCVNQTRAEGIARALHQGLFLVTVVRLSDLGAPEYVSYYPSKEVVEQAVREARESEQYGDIDDRPTRKEHRHVL